MTAPDMQLPDLRLLDMTLCADSNAVRRALARARGALIRAGIGDEVCGRCEIALAEALNNIVEHAYADAAPGHIVLRLDLSARDVIATLLDAGRALPGATLPAGRCPDLNRAARDMPEGGFGWFLIRQLADEVEYVRETGGNRLTLRLAREVAAPRPDPGAE